MVGRYMLDSGEIFACCSAIQYIRFECGPTIGAMLRRRIAIIQNIPAPYRLHMFKAIDRACNRRGWELSVHFMARSEPRREHWKPHSDDLAFSHHFWRDFGVTFGAKAWHLNPGMINAIRRHPPDVLMIGGPWDSLTGAIATILLKKRVPVRVGWLELNPFALGRQDSISRRIKQKLLLRFSHLATQGEGGIKGLRAMIGEKVPILVLPNIVEEARFLAASNMTVEERARIRSRYALDPTSRLIIWPARPSPEKGLMEFLSLMDREIVADSQIAIFGNGPLEADVREIIARKGLVGRVVLRDAVSYQEMPLLYGAADLFLMASLREKGCLSLVEAMFSGLPILLSRQVGSSPEALLEERNGWGMDMSDPLSITEAAAKAFSAPPARLKEMGKESIKIANNCWATESAVDRFLDAVLASA